MIERLFERGVVRRMGAREIRADSTENLRVSLMRLSAMTPMRMLELGTMSDRASALRAAALDDLGVAARVLQRDRVVMDHGPATPGTRPYSLAASSSQRNT